MAHSGRHRRDGRAELRPGAPAAPVEPERGARAARLHAGERRSSSRFRSHLRRDRARAPAGCAARARGGRAHRRVAADPQPRHDRGQSRHVVARGRLAAAAARRARRGRVHVGARHPPGPARRVRHRRQTQRARAGRTDHRGVGDAVAGASDVHEDRPAQRHGDRGRVARRLGGRRAARLVRLGIAAPRARDGAARRGGFLRRARRGRRRADRRRPRQRALSPPRAARAHGA